MFFSIALFLTVYKIPSVIYLFQIKEFRFDRVRIAFEEFGLLPSLYSTEFKLPAKTVRNLLIAVLSLVFTAFLFFYGFVGTDNQIFLQILLVALSPFLTFFVVSCAVMITTVLSYLKRQTLMKRAEHHLKKTSCVVIGVTGSFGKTTAKNLLFELLSTRYPTAKTDENMNTEVGVALSILKNLKSETRFFVAEMGAYRIGEIKTICDFVHPTYGVITGIGNQHTALFGSIAHLRQTKYELIHSLPKGGIAYVNDQTNNAAISLNNQNKKIIYTGKNLDDIRIKRSGPDRTGFEIHYRHFAVHLQTPFPERYVSSLAPAIALALDLGIPQKTVAQKLQEFLSNTYNRMVHKTGNRYVIDFSYNTSADSFFGTIEFLNQNFPENTVIFTKGIIELGKEKLKTYQKILSLLKITKIQLITTDRMFVNKEYRANIIYVNNESDMVSELDKNSKNRSVIALLGRFSKPFKTQLIERIKRL